MLIEAMGQTTTPGLFTPAFVRFVVPNGRLQLPHITGSLIVTALKSGSFSSTNGAH